MFDFLKPKRSSSITFVEVNSTLDYSALPKGFFRCLTASGVETLGYNGSFLAWKVGETVVDGNRRVILDKPRTELPIVKLAFASQQSDGVQRVLGHRLLDTAELGDQFDGNFTYDPLR